MSAWGRRRAVLAVNVPGRAPYAVLETGYRRPRGKADYVGAGLPALVSTTDPTDVEILWDEVPSLEDQISQRIGDALQGQQAQMEQAKEMLAAAQKRRRRPGDAGHAGRAGGRAAG